MSARNKLFGYGKAEESFHFLSHDSPRALSLLQDSAEERGRLRQVID